MATKKKASRRKARKKTPNQIAYDKELKRIKEQVRKMEKRGYYINGQFLPERPKRITKQAIQKLQGLRVDDLYKISWRVDSETGEMTPGDVAIKAERRERSKKGWETRRRNQMSKDALLNQTEPFAVVPGGQAGKTKAATAKKKNPVPAGLVMFDNLVLPLLERLKPDDVDTTVLSKKGKVLFNTVEEAKAELKEKLEKLIASKGKEGVGIEVGKHAEEIGHLMDVIMFSSDVSKIKAAVAKIVSIIFGNTFSMKDNINATMLDEEETDLNEEMYM